MSWNKNASGGGDSGAELTMPSDEEARSLSSRSVSQHRLNQRLLEVPLKEPWVPAPGRTSKIRSRSFTAAVTVPDQNVSSAESGHVVGKSLLSLPSWKQSAQQPNKVKRKGRSRSKRSRSIDDRKMSGYTLQSKDSLIDVTACLNKRRDEVFKLWEKNVLNCDSTLLAELENANMLAIEATNDVNDLRKTIDNLKKKSGKLTENDTKSLDALRSRILLKLERFEASHDHIQKSLQTSRESSRNPKSRESKKSEPEVKIIEKSSETKKPIISKKPSAEELPSEASSLIYLKTITESFSDETENEVDYEDFEEPLDDKGSNSRRVHSNPPVNPRVTSRNSSKEKQGHSRSKSKGRASAFEGMNSAVLVDSIYYRDKIRGLHRKLMEQEAKCVEMKRAMKRIESQNQYEIKLLKSNMKAQIEDMGHLPEMLELTEDRLNESLHAKFAIESTLQLKISEIHSLKTEIERLEKDHEALQIKLQSSDAKNETLSQKLERLELENKELRMDAWNKTQLLATLEVNYSKQKQNSAIQETSHPPSRDQKFLLLEDKISELETELETANKETLAMRRAKHDISLQLNRRIDELMDTLDTSRAKNRSLQSQINLIKTKYYQIFVPGESSQNVFPEISKVLAQAHHSRQIGGDGNDLA